jgi:hypothetical protein
VAIWWKCGWTKQTKKEKSKGIKAMNNDNSRKKTFRNPVAVGASMRKGSGAHVDKKAAMKRGDTPKHKNKRDDFYENLDQRLNDKLAEFQDRMAGVGMGDYEPREDSSGGPEYNDEVGMVKTNLATISHAIKELSNSLHAHENIPEWAQEKIAVAKSMIVAAKDYMLSQHSAGNIYTAEAKKPTKPTKVLRIGDEWQVHINEKIIRIPSDEANDRDEALQQAKKNLGINEGWGKAALGTVAFISAILGINHMHAQHLIHNDPQLSKLAHFRDRAVRNGDTEKVKELDRRIQSTLDHLEITGDEVRDETGNPVDPVYEWTHDSLAARLFEQENTYEDKLQNTLNKKLKK